MKKYIAILSLSALIFTACKDKEENFAGEEPASVELKDTVATDNTEVAVPEAASARPAEGSEITVSGKVTEINNGKDGYTAKLETAEGEHYSATISIPNMNDPKDFRRVETGEDITVTGEVVNLENDILIKVTKLH